MAGLAALWPPLEAVAAYRRTRHLAQTLRSRDDVAAWQRHRIARLLAETLPAIAYYRRIGARRLDDLPIVDKAVLMGDFAAFNNIGLDAATAWQALASGGRHGGHFVGASTGTSGNRGLYVISERERWRWLGTMLAKTMPRLRRARVALILPLDTSLYDAARRSMLDFRFLDLRRGLDACCADAAEFDPDTLIAPPRVLRVLAQSGRPFRRLRHIFSAAEVLDPLDRAAIEARFGTVLRDIYMATEGLLGVACEHGTLHLSEDTMAFEFEAPVPGSGLVTPVITDFSRDTQAMVRYRMNDLLRLSPTPCSCGSPFRAVAQVEGRMDDLLELPRGGGTCLVTPDILRNAIVGADRRIDDFRLVQTGRDTLLLGLAAGLPAEAADAARRALAARLASLGIAARIECGPLPAAGSPGRKLRRVERRWPA